MSKEIKDALPPPNEPGTPGFCSATCVDRPCLQNEIKKPELKTSDLYATCNLPKRFEYPHWFNGYGNQVSRQHPFFRTSANEYGWYPPGYHTVPTAYFPKRQAFTNLLALTGMYRNYSLNTFKDKSTNDRYYSVSSVFFPAGQTFTGRLFAAGMYRNYSLNTGMDRPSY